MKRNIITIIVAALLVVGGAYAATVVTELHSFSKTYTDRITVQSRGKSQVVTVTGTVQGTITDQDTLPDPVTVTETVTVGTTTAPPPPPPPPTGCSVSVAPGGDLTAAYNSVPGGGVVCLGSGNYGSFTTPGGSKNVTFRGVYPGTLFRSIDVQADNFHLESVEIRGSDSTSSRDWPVGPILHTAGTSNFSFKTGKVSRARDHMMVMVGGQTSASNLLNPVFDGIVFSDLEFSGLVPDAHGECMYSQAPGLVVRNSTFRNCWVMDLFITRGTWWGQEEYGNVTIENNVFWHSVLEPNGWHYYGFVQAYDNEAFNFTIRNNWFENNVNMSGPFTGNSVVCGNNTGIMPAGFQPLADAVPASWKTPCA